MLECNHCMMFENDMSGISCRSVHCPQWIALSVSKEPIKSVYINKSLTLSTIVNNEMETELCASGRDETLETINRDDGKQICITIIEHFKGRCLTDDEADAIARLI